MALSSTLADTGSEVVGFLVPKLSKGSIPRQFIGPDETAIMARCLLCTNFYPLPYLSGISISLSVQTRNTIQSFCLQFSLNGVFLKPRGKEH